MNFISRYLIFFVAMKLKNFNTLRHIETQNANLLGQVLIHLIVFCFNALMLKNNSSEV